MAWRDYTPVEKAKVVIATAAIVSFSGLFVYIAFAEQPRAPVTDRYGCLADTELVGHTVVLVDNTDAFSPGQVEHFQATMEDVAGRLADWEMISIFSIVDGAPRRLFLQCSPEQAQPPNPWDFFDRPNESWLQRKARFQREFEKPLRELVGSMPLNDTASYSPLIESFAQALSSAGQYWLGVQNRRIIIYSDMMENTAIYSQYRSRDFLGDYESTNEDRETLDLAFENVHVEIHYLTGLPHNTSRQGRIRQGQEHREFWDAFFRDRGATEVTFTEVSGDLGPAETISR